MAYIKELLEHLLRPGVSEIALATARNPCAKVNGTYEIIDRTILSSDEILMMLMVAGGARHVDGLGVKPTTWGVRVEGIGAIGVAAVANKGSVQARFSVMNRETAQRAGLASIPPTGKFGVGIGLITQRPGKLDQDVLSQCMTQIIMRIVNPIDQQTVAQSVEGAGRAMLAELPALTKGQAVISGVGINTPVMCRIRQRLTKHGGETFDAPAEWQKWHSPDSSSKRDEGNSPYLKPDSGKKTEKIGNIRI